MNLISYPIPQLESLLGPFSPSWIGMRTADGIIERIILDALDPGFIQVGFITQARADRINELSDEDTKQERINAQVVMLKCEWEKEQASTKPLDAERHLDRARSHASYARKLPKPKVTKDRKEKSKPSAIPQALWDLL